MAGEINESSEEESSEDEPEPAPEPEPEEGSPRLSPKKVTDDRAAAANPKSPWVSYVDKVTTKAVQLRTRAALGLPYRMRIGAVFAGR